MAYVTPKENWTVEDVPVSSDFNRIEGNAKANHDAIIAGDAAEAVARDAAIAASLASGTYTPTGVSITNVVSIVEGPVHYLKLGNMVHMTGRMTIYVSTLYVRAAFYIDPPIASAFSSSSDACGVISCGTTSYQTSGMVYGTAGRLYFEIGYPPASSPEVYFTVTYKID